VDTTGEQLSVELKSKMRKITIDREKTKVVGDKAGALNRTDKPVTAVGPDGLPTTPYLSSDTPRHFAGSETPHHALGSETPMHYGGGAETPRGNQTPGGGGGGQDDFWQVGLVE
jgi:transcription elongation factor